MEPAQVISAIGAFGDMSKLQIKKSPMRGRKQEKSGPSLFLLRAAPPVTISVAHDRNGRPKWFLDLIFIISVSACDFHMQN